jgi:N-acetyl-alpha-D-muramate 1-phosphate uridylyltransferase
VIDYDKRSWRPDMTHIDFGISVLSSSVFLPHRETRVIDLADICRELSKIGQLAGIEVSDRFYEVGSPQGIQDTEAYLLRQMAEV